MNDGTKAMVHLYQPYKGILLFLIKNCAEILYIVGCTIMTPCKQIKLHCDMLPVFCITFCNITELKMIHMKCMDYCYSQFIA